jgi:hypothetical protein
MVRYDVACAVVTTIGGDTYSAVETVTEDRDYYSKSWHRRYGPKRNWADRRVVVEHADGSKEVLERLNRWPMKKNGGPYLTVVKHIPIGYLPPLIVNNKDPLLSAALCMVLSKKVK